MTQKIFIYITVLLLYNSCSYPEITSDILVFDEDFENMLPNEIDGGHLSSYNNTMVLGDFNNDGFTIHITDPGDHDYVFLSFDLYIHGSWDGNKNGFQENDKADKWIIEFKPDMDLHKDPDFDRFETTFSNSPCYSNYCLKQSYPGDYPSDNNPGTGHIETNLPKKCNNNFFSGPTSLYKIEKGFNSTGGAVVVRFFDELYQPNAIDKDGIPQQKCDESWSLDNLKIRVVKYN